MSDDDIKKPFEKDDIDDIFDLVEEGEDYAVDADEVIVSSDDDNLTPTGAALARDEFDEKEISAHIVPIDQDALAAEAASESRRGVISFILAILRIPENAIKTIFQATPLYGVLNKSKRYREFERNNALSSTLEDKALVPSKKVSRFGLFAANNFLVTCGLLVGLYFSLDFSIASVLEVNSVREAVGLTRVDDGTTTLAEGRQVRSQARFSNRRREAVVRDLDHCSITKFAREEILASINSDGRLDSNQLKKSFSAMKRFRETFAGKSLSNSLDTARSRRDMIVESVKPAYMGIVDAVQNAKARRSQVQSKMNSTQKRLDSINNRIGKLSIGDINTSINLRDEIETYRQELALTPTNEDITLLDEVLSLLGEALDGKAQPLPLAETESQRTPDWIFNIRTLDDPALEKSVAQFAKNSLRFGERKLRDDRWPVVTYYFGVVTLSTNQLIRALETIDTEPYVAMRQLDRIQRAVNEQIDVQFGAAGKQWVNYRGCLNVNDTLVENLD